MCLKHCTLPGKYSSSTYGNGNIQKVYEDGTARWFDANGEPIDDPTVKTYKGIEDLGREGYLNQKVSDNSVSIESSEESGYNGIEDSKREEYSDQNISNNNTSTESGVNYSDRYSGSSIDSRSGDFNLTTDNNKFTMTDADKVKVAAIIYGEAVEGSPDDALAVASVMANRVDAGNWGGSEKGIVGVATAANQFVAYGGTKYNKFMTAYQNGTLNEGMKICLDAVNDVAKGIRNNSYESFTGNGVYNKYR